MNNSDLKKLLDNLYEIYSKKHSSQDPVWFLHELKNEKDIEILGLIASSYSYGNIKQINRFISAFLSVTGLNVYEFTSNYSELKDKKFLNNLNYRFNSSDDLSDLIMNLRSVTEKHGNLKNLFKSGYKNSDVNIIPALQKFTSEIKKGNPQNSGLEYLIPSPAKNSACKRLNLYLRWMIRKDETDIGIWNDEFEKSKLLMPVDTHIYRISRKLGLVKRKSCDLKFSLELTERLKKYDNEDPVKYDFALCHFQKEVLKKNLLNSLNNI